MIASGTHIEQRLIRATMLIGATNWLLLLFMAVIGQGKPHLEGLFNPVAWGILWIPIALVLISIRTIRRALMPLAAPAQAIAALNTRMSRMEKDAQRQQRRCDDMIHDLRTSLSVLQLQADLHDHIATEKLQPHLRDMAQLISEYLARA